MNNQQKDSQPPVVNIANFLTVLRLLLVPVFVGAFWEVTPQRAWIGFAVFAFAALTDKLDGYLARSRNLVTDFGKLADSIADKALISSALILLSAHGLLWWWVTILMIGRELAITVMRMFLARRQVMAAGQGGKIKMVFQSVGIGLALVPWDSFLPSGFATAGMWFAYALLAVSLVFSLSSAVGYVNDARRIIREGTSDSDS